MRLLLFKLCIYVIKILGPVNHMSEVVDVVVLNDLIEATAAADVYF